VAWRKTDAQGEVVENKRLGAAIAAIQATHAIRDAQVLTSPKRTLREKARVREARLQAGLHERRGVERVSAGGPARDPLARPAAQLPSQLAIGVPLNQIQHWLDQSTITMTMRYAHLAPGSEPHRRARNGRIRGSKMAANAHGRRKAEQAQLVG
jgi:hypothetical protein